MRHERWPCRICVHVHSRSYHLPEGIISSSLAPSPNIMSQHCCYRGPARCNSRDPGHGRTPWRGGPTIPAHYDRWPNCIHIPSVFSSAVATSILKQEYPRQSHPLIDDVSILLDRILSRFVLEKGIETPYPPFPTEYIVPSQRVNYIHTKYILGIQ